jgi:hypothetical protein
VCLLDPILHTRKRVQRRSPFLFTAVLFIVLNSTSFRLGPLYSRVGVGPEQYRRMDELMDHYSHGIQTSGFKSVEVCQGMLLLACFSKAAAAFENDRTWTTIGTVRLKS